MKAVFVPLKTEFYREFESGNKLAELRKYGNRWNEEVCWVGRPITLSHGYTKERLHGKITKFEKRHGQTFGYTDSKDILNCYGTLDIWLAVIWIRIER